jgi:hypothetical protein
MLSYSDYDGSQGDVAVIDGCTQPIDEMALHKLAQNAMELAVGATHADSHLTKEPAFEAAVA